MIENIKVNSLIDLLSTHNRKKYDALLQKYPDNTNLLDEGIPLGSISADAKALGELAIESLSVSMESIRKISSQLQNRLKKANRIRLVANLTGAFTSAGIISMLTTGPNKCALLVTAIVNFSSVAFIIISNFFETSLFGNKDKMQNFLQEIITMAVDAEMLKSEINILLLTQESDSEVIDAVKKANLIAAQLRAKELNVGHM